MEIKTRENDNKRRQVCNAIREGDISRVSQLLEKGIGQSRYIYICIRAIICSPCLHQTICTRLNFALFSIVLYEFFSLGQVFCFLDNCCILHYCLPGCSLNFVVDDKTPLAEAASNGSKEIIDLLLASGLEHMRTRL